MNQKYRNYIMWALYALLFLLVMLVQTTVFGRVRFYGVKLNLMPVVMVCIAMGVGHEAGGLFGLVAAVVWFAAGADDGVLAMVSFTLMGILAGYLCDAVFSRRFLPAFFLTLGALVFHEGAVFLLKYYLEGAAGELIRWVPVSAGLSVLACPVIYPAAKAIRKVGGRS